MAVTHTAADATAATTMTNAVADIEQETPEIEKERQLAGVGAGAGTVANGKKKPHDHALASILGPAFVAAVAYVDPGNVAANITSGARYGYLLVWVLVLANAMSVLIQYQSAKLGIVTNKSLPELLGERMSDAGRFMFFMQAEVIAIATDLAEVIGGAIALNLLFGLPLFIGGLVIGAISTVMLWFQGGKTQTTFERIIIVMLLIITFGFIAGLFVAPPNPGEVVKGMIPRFQGADSVLMAASILGATVMPHAIYLHSTLVNDHYAGGEKPSIKTQLRGSKIDVAWALLLAGTYAGSEIMHGLLHVNAPMWACRVVTLVPALIVLWFAKDPTQALVIGQVVLSIGIPFAVIPLMRYTHNKELMGKWADGTVKHVIFMIVVALIVALNVLLIVLTLMGRA